MILIKNGTIYTMENDQVLTGDILVNGISHVSHTHTGVHGETSGPH